MENRNIPYKIYLDEGDMPQAWYNLRSDMKNKPAPLLNPGTGYFDMTAYQAVNDGKMTDYIPSPPTPSLRRASPRSRKSPAWNKQTI